MKFSSRWYIRWYILWFLIAFPGVTKEETLPSREDIDQTEQDKISVESKEDTKDAFKKVPLKFEDNHSEEGEDTEVTIKEELEEEEMIEKEEEINEEIGQWYNLSKLGK